MIKLPDDMPEFCCGCANCILKGEDKCLYYAYDSPIVRKIESADLIIFATPVFVGSCSGSMKTFLDHLAYKWLVHRPNGNRKPSLKMKFFFNIFKRLEQN